MKSSRNDDEYTMDLQEEELVKKMLEQNTLQEFTGKGAALSSQKRDDTETIKDTTDDQSLQVSCEAKAVSRPDTGMTSEGAAMKQSDEGKIDFTHARLNPTAQEDLENVKLLSDKFDNTVDLKPKPSEPSDCTVAAHIHHQSCNEKSQEKSRHPSLEESSQKNDAEDEQECLVTPQEGELPATGEAGTVTDEVFQRPSASLSENDDSPFFQLVDSSFQRTRPDLDALLHSLPSLSQEEEIVRQMLGKLVINRTVIIVGPDGCGKTTAALMLARWTSGDAFKRIRWCLSAAEVHTQSPDLAIIDDFLGKDRSESFQKWRLFHDCIAAQGLSDSHQPFFVLTSRSSVYEYVHQHTGADFGLLTLQHLVVHLSIDHRTMWKDLLPGMQPDESIVCQTPSIGFPLCCRLVSHVSPDVRHILFHQPRRALCEAVKELFDASDISKAALSLLAVSDHYLDTQVLQDPDKLLLSDYYNEPLQALQEYIVEPVRPLDIVKWYENNECFILMQGEFASFANEAIQRAVLVEVCYWNVEFLCKFCSMHNLLQLGSSATETSSEMEQWKPPVWLQDALLESVAVAVEKGHYLEGFTSSFLELEWCRSKFMDYFHQECLSDFLYTCDNNGLSFLFYAASVWISPLTDLQMKDSWCVLQVILGFCFWGIDSSMDKYFSAFKNKTAMKKYLKKASISQIATGDLPGVNHCESPDWKKTPLYPEDTLLTLAARRGKDAVVRKLVYRDMDLNTQGSYGRTALMHYCARGNADMVGFLLKRGADPKLTDSFGHTAAYYAYQRQNWRIPDELFDAKNKQLISNLVQLACANGWTIRTIKNLISLGGDIMHKDDSGLTCLHLACKNGHADVVSFLLKETCINARQITKEGLTPLLYALTSPGRSDLVKALLKSPARNDAECAIEGACKFSDEKVFRMIFTVLVPDHDTRSKAMAEACQFGNCGVLQYLLHKKEVNLAEKNKESGDTWLHFACEGPSLDCVNVLQKKLDVNAQNNAGVTPLMLAVRKGRMDFAKLLQRGGARFNIQDKNNNCILHYAIQSPCPAVLPWCIREQPSDLNALNDELRTPLMLACVTGNCRAILCLLDNGADPSLVDAEGNTCLHLAALNSRGDALHVLLKRGCTAALTVENTQGKTPIFLAVEKGNVYVFKYLKEFITLTSK